MHSFRPTSPVFRRFLRTRPSVARRPLNPPRIGQPSPTPIPTLETPGAPPAIVDHEAVPLAQQPLSKREQERESITPIRRTSQKQKQADDIVRSEEKNPSADKDLSGLSKYAYRWDTTAPNGEQLARADKFFMHIAPELLWTKSKFREIERGNAPEVSMIRWILTWILGSGWKPGWRSLRSSYGC